MAKVSEQEFNPELRIQSKISSWGFELGFQGKAALFILHIPHTL